MKNSNLLVVLLTLAGLATGRAATTHDVDIINSTFSPSSVSAQVSDSVRWTMRDSFIEHTSTSGNGTPNGLWDSGLLQSPGETFTHVFTTAGSFPYYCQPHFFFMTGNVTVTGGNTAPTVTITGPADGANFVGPTNLTFQANATDDGSVVRVQFFDGEASMGF